MAHAAKESGYMISLDRCIIRVAPDQPVFVGRAVNDLADVLEHFTGKRPAVHTPGEPLDSFDPDADVELRIGLQSAAELAAQAGLQSGAGPETFFIVDLPTTNSDPSVIALGGADPTGVKFAVFEFIRRLRVAPGRAEVETPLLVTRSPRFAIRSMYAHLHWWYNHPYALRSWPLEDWKRYIDLLSHLGFNTIQMWPMMELIPHPLSDADRQYLSKYRDVIDYLHEQRGMKGFVGSCPNNITEDARGVPIEKREYFDFEKLLDPGQPENLRRILDYRSDLYQTVPNADGYWVIDSDPGGWKGSPSSDFASILVGHRELIDRFGDRPAEQALIYWMWYGWGTGRKEYNYGQVLGELVGRINGHWRVHVCNPDHVRACEGLRLSDRAIYFPYNLIEDEPSGPMTDPRLGAVRDAALYAADHNLTAIQGNAQTPLVQLPNIVAMVMASWGDDPTDAADGAFARLAHRLVCRDADVVVAAWESLTRDDPQACLELAGRLRELAGDASARGTLAVLIKEWQPVILEDLATMVTIRAHALRFAQAETANADEGVIAGTLSDYLAETARWLHHTGYHNKRIVMNKPYFDPVFYSMCRLQGRLGGEALSARIVGPAVKKASETAPSEFVEYVVETVAGRRQ